jgi:GAF domain-containing protein
MVPIRRSDPVGAIGVYWSRRHTASPDELALLQGLADDAAAAIERIGLDSAPWAPRFNLPVEASEAPA